MLNTALTIRQLTSDDLNNMLLLEQRSHDHPWKPANFESSLRSHSCYGLFRGEQFLGHAVLSFVVGEAELLLFVIERSEQGKGFGKQFLNELMPLAGARAQSIFLEVRESNTAAIALYEASGFCQVGERPNYYPSDSNKRETALLYALDLQFAD